MGFAMLDKEGESCPVLICDTCGEPIDKWKSAAAAYDLSAAKLAVVSIYHKGNCDPGSTGRREESAMLWMPLDQYLSWLINNNKWGILNEGGDKFAIDVPPEYGV